MNHNKDYAYGILSKAIDDRDKLLHNNKDAVEQHIVHEWTQGFLPTHEFVNKIKTDIVRESFMYLTIVIYEMEEKINQENKKRMENCYSN
jgi:hypothetical protein